MEHAGNPAGAAASGAVRADAEARALKVFCHLPAGHQGVAPGTARMPSRLRPPTARLEGNSVKQAFRPGDGQEPPRPAS